MTDANPRLSLRIDFPNGMRFGPGKADLLKQLIETGSIRAAANTLSMSYPRALKLIDQLNETFSKPIVQTQTGGASGGGASVTELGHRVLDLYMGLCLTASDTNQQQLEDLGKFLAK